MPPIITVENLCKTYRLGARQAPYATLRESLVNAVKAPLRWLDRSKRNGQETLHALRDVSFTVEPGEVVGIIGRNGAGKSTLLKILSRITEPTRGEVIIRGRVGSLLEVGTGFHPELTGRDNIYLNGAILGMKRREIARKFDEIVAFAEVDRFIDTAVKYYSSGMYMRLAFAVAAHLEPEILIVDEVLAVGDAEFQKKCLGKMSDVARQGRTVLFVSHNMAAVQKLCQRAVLLDRGRLKCDGSAPEVTSTYLTTGQMEGRLNTALRRFPPKKVEVMDGWLERDGERVSTLLFGDEVSLVLEVRVHEPTRFSVELLLRQQDGLPVAFGPSGLAKDWEVDGDVGDLRIRCRLPRIEYACGGYTIDIMLAVTGVQFLDYLESGLAFHVESAAVGNRTWAFNQGRGQGCMLWDVGYELECAGSK